MEIIFIIIVAIPAFFYVGFLGLPAAATVYEQMACWFPAYPRDFGYDNFDSFSSALKTVLVWILGLPGTVIGVVLYLLWRLRFLKLFVINPITKAIKKRKEKERKIAWEEEKQERKADIEKIYFKTKDSVLKPIDGLLPVRILLYPDRIERFGKDGLDSVLFYKDFGCVNLAGGDGVLYGRNEGKVLATWFNKLSKDSYFLNSKGNSSVFETYDGEKIYSYTQYYIELIEKNYYQKH